MAKRPKRAPDRGEGERRPEDDGMGALQARDEDGLTVRERRFVEGYLASACGARAARQLGFEAATARAQGRAMLAKGHIGAAILKERERILARYRTDTASLVAELAKVAHCNVADFVVVDQETGQASVDLRGVPHEAMAGLGEVRVEETVLQVREDGGEDGAPLVRRELVRVKTTVKTRDKRAAIADLLRLNGAQIDPPGPEGARMSVTIIAGADPSEAARIYQRVLFGGSADQAGGGEGRGGAGGAAAGRGRLPRP